MQIIIGYNDPTVVPQHALTFLKACIEAGTQPDFFTYPGQGHNMRGHQSVHLHERITQYFDDYLKPLKQHCRGCHHAHCYIIYKHTMRPPVVAGASAWVVL